MRGVSRSQTTQNVFRNLSGARLALGYDPRPVCRLSGKHDTVVGIDPHRRRLSARKTFGILRPFRAKPARSEDDEILRRTIVMARNRKTAFVLPFGNRGAVAFVADE